MKTVKDLIPQIDKNKYAKWAADLDAEQLEALLMLVGEHFLRSPNPMKVVQEEGVYQLDIHQEYPGDRRKALAYNELIKFHRCPHKWKSEKFIYNQPKEITDPDPSVRLESIICGSYFSNSDNNDNTSCVQITLAVGNNPFCIIANNLPAEVATKVKDWLIRKLS